MEDYMIPNVLKQHYQSTDLHGLVDEILEEFRTTVLKRSEYEAIRLLLSTQNYIERSQWKDASMPIYEGDLCFIDFGSAYQLEAGYQHLGLVLSISHRKLFVIPMSSNFSAYQSAFDSKDNPWGKKHLLRFKKSCGLKKDSILFLNDAKFINSTRVIEIIGHLSIHDKRYKQIQARVFETLFKAL